MNVFIVDDELHVRRRLESKINWESYGVTGLSLFDDGDLALEAITAHTPDILLTDIRMPRMDGIKLSRAALQINPNLRIILISAHDDKQYLKSAIDLQVLGYIEKPFDILAVDTLVQKAVAEIAANAKQAAQFENLALRSNLQALSELARSLSRFRASYQEIADELAQLLPGFLHQNYYTSVLIQLHVDPVDAEEPDVFALFQELYPLWNQETMAGIITETNNLTLLLHLGSATKEELTAQITVLDEQLSLLSPDTGIRIAVGTVITDYQKLYQSYQDAVICMERHFFYDTPILFAQPDTASVYTFSDTMLDDFALALQNHNSHLCYAMVKQLKEDLLAHDHTLTRSIKNYYFRLIILILNQSALGHDTLPNYSDYYLWETIFYVDTLNKLDEYVTELLEHYFTANQRPGLSALRTDEILTYIREHFDDPTLSLSAIAKAHYMSVPYLCMFFKEQTGKTIKSFLIDYRMQRASDLLLHSDLRIVEIAEQTGFSNQNYFTKRFSKYFGISPSKYKEERR